MDRFSFGEKVFLIGAPCMIAYALLLPASDQFLQYVFSFIPSFD